MSINHSHESSRSNLLIFSEQQESLSSRDNFILKLHQLYGIPISNQSELYKKIKEHYYLQGESYRFVTNKSEKTIELSPDVKFIHQYLDQLKQGKHILQDLTTTIDTLLKSRVTNGQIKETDRVKHSNFKEMQLLQNHSLSMDARMKQMQSKMSQIMSDIKQSIDQRQFLKVDRKDINYSNFEQLPLEYSNEINQTNYETVESKKISMFKNDLNNAKEVTSEYLLNLRQNKISKSPQKEQTNMKCSLDQMSAKQKYLISDVIQQNQHQDNQIDQVSHHFFPDNHSKIVLTEKFINGQQFLKREQLKEQQLIREQTPSIEIDEETSKLIKNAIKKSTTKNTTSPQKQSNKDIPLENEGKQENEDRPLQKKQNRAHFWPQHKITIESISKQTIKSRVDGSQSKIDHNQSTSSLPREFTFKRIRNDDKGEKPMIVNRSQGRSHQLVNMSNENLGRSFVRPIPDLSQNQSLVFKSLARLPQHRFQQSRQIKRLDVPVVSNPFINNRFEVPRNNSEPKQIVNIKQQMKNELNTKQNSMNLLNNRVYSSPQMVRKVIQMPRSQMISPHHLNSAQSQLQLPQTSNPERILMFNEKDRLVRNQNMNLSSKAKLIESQRHSVTPIKYAQANNLREITQINNNFKKSIVSQNPSNPFVAQSSVISPVNAIRPPGLMHRQEKRPQIVQSLPQNIKRDHFVDDSQNRNRSFDWKRNIGNLNLTQPIQQVRHSQPHLQPQPQPQPKLYPQPHLQPYLQPHPQPHPQQMVIQPKIIPATLMKLPMNAKKQKFSFSRNMNGELMNGVKNRTSKAHLHGINREIKQQRMEIKQQSKGGSEKSIIYTNFLQKLDNKNERGTQFLKYNNRNGLPPTPRKIEKSQIIDNPFQGKYQVNQNQGPKQQLSRIVQMTESSMQNSMRKQMDESQNNLLASEVTSLISVNQSKRFQSGSQRLRKKGIQVTNREYTSQKMGDS